MANNRTDVLCERLDTLIFRSFAHNFKSNLSLPRLLKQLSVANTVISIMRLVLKPLNQASFIPEILGGICLGPTFLGRIDRFNELLFPQLGFLTIDVYEKIGFMFLIVLMGVRTDVNIVKTASRLAFIIAFASTFFPLAFSTALAYYLRHKVDMSLKLHDTLPSIAFYQCLTSFQVISTILADAKLLNSELGRLALSASIISGAISWFLAVFATSWKEISDHKGDIGMLETNLCKVGMVLVIIFVFRPILHWMVRQTPEGKPLKEDYFIAIVLTVVGLALYGEVFGIHFLMCPTVFSLVVPDGPPMGSTVVEHLTYAVSVMFLPCYVINVGRRFNLTVVTGETFLIVSLIVVVSMAVKLVAVIIPALYFKIPMLDALSLGCILNFQGWLDVQYYDRALSYKILFQDVYAVMVLTAIARSAILVPLVQYLYDPSRRYIAYKRRTIQHSKQYSELRLLVCIHEEDDVLEIMDLLYHSISTLEHPIGVYVLDLKELQGRASPLLIAHPSNKPPASNPTRTDRIMNVFRKFELNNLECVKAQSFTAVAPYVTMHDEVCTLALDKETVLIILPFKKTYGAKIRAMQRSVLEMAPCSVGIMVFGDVEINHRSLSSCDLTSFKVCMLFFGGPDDREALLLSARLAHHPTTKLTVLRVFSVIDEACKDLIERRMDVHAIEGFNMQTFGNKRVCFAEERVEEATQTIAILSSLRNEDYNLVLVGRRHDEDSSVLMGISEWTEIEELGVIGDMLGSSDFSGKFSLLVIQQQASVVQEMIEPKLISRE